MLSIADNLESLAKIGQTLGEAGINIEGICGLLSEDQSFIHILVNNPKTARIALKKRNIEIIEEREVLILDKNKLNVIGKPGAFGEICTLLANAGIKIDLVYAAENDRLVLGVDDVARALDVI
ncbi:MAG: hypothetical protein ACW99A_03565 [Candidatus Kariarchaeaceae archaeon]